MPLAPDTAGTIAQVILGVHITIAGFIIFGMIVIPLGARLGWSFVSAFWWRLAHVAAMGVVAVQKAFGDTCFLSVWERQLVGVSNEVPHEVPAFQSFGEHLLYWNLPLWFFTWLYGLMFVAAIVFWFVVPPRKPKGPAQTLP